MHKIISVFGRNSRWRRWTKSEDTQGRKVEQSDNLGSACKLKIKRKKEVSGLDIWIESSLMCITRCILM